MQRHKCKHAYLSGCGHTHTHTHTYTHTHTRSLEIRSESTGDGNLFTLLSPLHCQARLVAQTKCRRRNRAEKKSEIKWTSSAKNFTDQGIKATEGGFAASLTATMVIMEPITAQLQQSEIYKRKNVWIQHCNISMIPICCISLEELRGLASNQLCHGNVGWWPAYGAVGGSEGGKTDWKRERERARWGGWGRRRESEGWCCCHGN